MCKLIFIVSIFINPCSINYLYPYDKNSCGIYTNGGFVLLDVSCIEVYKIIESYKDE